MLSSVTTSERKCECLTFDLSVQVHTDVSAQHTINIQGRNFDPIYQKFNLVSKFDNINQNTA